MAKLIITRGLPGSGKTTAAKKWVAEDPVRRARVNRDDLRAMLHESRHVTDGSGTEQSVRVARNAAITALLKRGVDVTCDDTNLPARTCRDLRALATLAGAYFEVWDLTDVTLDECLRRNAARTDKKPVPEEWIRDQWSRYVKNRPWPLALPDAEGDELAVEPYLPRVGTPRTALVDIDGTVALMVNRGPYDEHRVHEDRPNLPVIANVRALHAAGYRIVFCSGRTDACRAATEEWLHEHVGLVAYNEPYELYMRAAGDGRRDSVVKLEIFNKHIRDTHDVWVVLDDRRQVVDMWRSLGLTVLQVAEGNF